MECEHDQQELRRRIASNGIEHYVMQCLRCGMHVRAVKKDTIPAGDQKYLPLWDNELASTYATDQRATRHREQDVMWAERRYAYTSYLQSVTWRRRRTLRLELDNGQCQAQMDGCQGFATEVHHLTYEFVGNEPLFTLVSVCRHCHRLISEMEGRINKDIAS